MENTYKSFAESIESPRTKYFVTYLDGLGKFDYSNCTVDYLEKIILEMKPNSLRRIIDICYVLGLYAKYLNNDAMYNIVKNINKNDLWNKIKSTQSRKFLSYELFQEIYNDIGLCEEYNGFYYQTIFKSIYEGIYNKDYSFLVNLRASDINNNIVTLKDADGNSYSLNITTQLADDLEELSTVDIWERKNRYGIIQITIDGLYHDTCFKMEQRYIVKPNINNIDNTIIKRYGRNYFRFINKIAKEYVDFKLSPFAIYISGIVHRINLELEKVNISLKDALEYNNRNRIVKKIIADELKRSNYNIEVTNFREIIRGYVNDFLPPKDDGKN